MARPYTTGELVFLGYSLSISAGLLFMGNPPQIATLPAVLAWLIVSRRAPE